MLQTLNCLCGPWQDSHEHACVLFVLVTPALHSAFQMWSHQHQTEEKNHLPWIAGNLVNHKFCKYSLSLCGGLIVQNEKSSSVKLLSIWSAAVGTGAQGYCSQVQNFLFPLFQLLEIPDGTFLRLLRSLWMAAQASDLSNILPSYGSSANLLKMCCLIIPVIKTLLTPWGTSGVHH